MKKENKMSKQKLTLNKINETGFLCIEGILNMLFNKKQKDLLVKDNDKNISYHLKAGGGGEFLIMKVDDRKKYKGETRFNYADLLDIFGAFTREDILKKNEVELLEMIIQGVGDNE